MQEFRKIQTIEVVKTNYKRNNGEEGILVQNKGDSSNRWIIPTEVFKATYEPVKNADYTILTEEQRKYVREGLTTILAGAIEQGKEWGASPKDTSEAFIGLQGEIGEKFKTFEDKKEFIEELIEGIKELSNIIPKDAKDFIKRIQEECTELIKKKVALQNFFATKIFYELDMEDKDLLYEQDRLMSRYIQILEKRMVRLEITDFIKDDK